MDFADGLDRLTEPSASALHPFKHGVELVVAFGGHWGRPLFKDEEHLLAAGLFRIGFGPLKARALRIDSHEAGLCLPKLEKL